MTAAIVGTGSPIVSKAEHDLWAIAHLSTALPAATYKLAQEPDAASATMLALGWALGNYAFEAFAPKAPRRASLVWPANADRARVIREAEALAIARDLINTPANHLGPVALPRGR